MRSLFLEARSLSPCSHSCCLSAKSAYWMGSSPLAIYCNHNSAETVGASLSSITDSRANVRSSGISVEGN
ncbi:hypothetical protein H6F74_09095 [Trichocoleus sp. FACHB-90]|uniref:hypothetical protein n=1 Tax=Cyanophyceae TaxID=3028117 RepID=UPI00168476AC|nr:hypothetical protein [Trichocoleus sp. FACHB-90]MBD1926403.1 hypothetical protein [Trichocoleus sp. FACHB-90]